MTEAFHGRMADAAVDRSAMTRRDVLALAALGLIAGAAGPVFAAAPQGQLTWGAHVSLAPTWFDPAETSGIITPFVVHYAPHDAMVKPLPGHLMAPSLATRSSLRPTRTCD